MTVRAMLLASAVMAASGLWTGSAGAAPIRADMSLQSDAVFEQVQMHGGRGSGGIGGGGGMSRGGGPGFSGGAAMNQGGGPGVSRGAAINRGGNWSGNRVISGGNWARNSDGRRFSDWRGRHRFHGSRFAFGFAPGFYDYGYPYDYGYYDDYAYGDDYVAASPGGDSSCQSRFRSYDPSTGTYLGYDGLRHPCP
jgi:BA14K-like protein